jgi:hypothetical protein
MTDEAILTKAIEKAEGNGFQWSTQYWRKRCLDLGIIESIIFSHDFARAFWGDTYVCSHCGGYADDKPLETANIYSEGFQHLNDTDCLSSSTEPTQAWKYHLQQMVLEENPIQYLERSLT